MVLSSSSIGEYHHRFRIIIEVLELILDGCMINKVTFARRNLQAISSTTQLKEQLITYGTCKSKTWNMVMGSFAGLDDFIQGLVYNKECLDIFHGSSNRIGFIGLFGSSLFQYLIRTLSTATKHPATATIQTPLPATKQPIISMTTLVLNWYINEYFCFERSSSKWPRRWTRFISQLFWLIQNMLNSILLTNVLFSFTDGRHAYDFNLELFDKLNKEVSTECVKVMHIIAMRTYLSLSNMVPPGCASNTAFTQRDGNEGTNFQVSTFTGMDPPYSLPDNVALLTLHIYSHCLHGTQDRCLGDSRASLLTNQMTTTKD
ncbi:galactose mutarotase-like domain-containing protein [Artemisia annua]|uniref:Galactose mutarotase-like domain-containing protein n=1 Tax=Artemisia annua TaxID=35608 RepID=A0A2U1LZZ0_ARTAN|nr:galactose mutarotase-like domain-containing protein [Artemisia annua]